MSIILRLLRLNKKQIQSMIHTNFVIIHTNSPMISICGLKKKSTNNPIRVQQEQEQSCEREQAYEQADEQLQRRQQPPPRQLTKVSSFKPSMAFNFNSPLSRFTLSDSPGHHPLAILRRAGAELLLLAELVAEVEPDRLVLVVAARDAGADEVEDAEELELERGRPPLLLVLLWRNRRIL